MITPPKPKRGGRPKGSKNKPHVDLSRAEMIEKLENDFRNFAVKPEVRLKIAERLARLKGWEKEVPDPVTDADVAAVLADYQSVMEGMSTPLGESSCG